MPSDKPDDANRVADDAVARYAIGRLVRSSNLAIFVIVAAGLACVAYVKTTHFFSDRQEFRGWLIALRVTLPIAALFVTGIATKQILSRFVQRVGGVDLTIADYLPAFSVCKTVSIVLLTIAGLFGSICLLFGHQTMDVLLAGLPILLLLISRPTY